MITDSKADSIVADVVYPHRLEQVWAALTSAEALAYWLMPNDFKPDVGHQFTFKTAPGQGWSGVVQCEVVALEPLKRLAFTWRSSPLDTQVTFDIEPVEGGTRLRLEHSGFGRSGEAGLTIRDIMGSGWTSNILGKRFPTYLSQQAIRIAVNS